MCTTKDSGMLYFASLEEILLYSFSKDYNLCSIPLQNYESHHGKVKTLLCHDMQGGYLCYDRLEGASLEEEQTLYTFFHWWYIDIFVYFSHNFITIPPVVWTNQAHRHGVIVLGTFITEDEGGATLCRKLFTSLENVEKLAAKMVELCEEFGFDGWLINIENPIESEHLPILEYFLVYLRQKLRDRIGKHAYLVWYDSVTTFGKLAWQNELNEKNQRWFDAVDAIFLNYTWKPDNLKASAMVAMKNSRCGEVFAGVDVFGRGQIGDGGWNCAEALAHVRTAGLSAAIFAPGWICETFPDACLFAQSARFWRLLRGYVAANRRVCAPFATDFSHGLRRVVGWFCMAEAQLQPFYLDDGMTKSENNFVEKLKEHETNLPQMDCSFSGLYLDERGLLLTNCEKEHTLFLCNIPLIGGDSTPTSQRRRLAIEARSDAPLIVRVYVNEKNDAEHVEMTLETQKKKNANDDENNAFSVCRAHMSLLNEKTQQIARPYIRRITAQCKSPYRSVHIQHIAIVDEKE